MTLDIILPVYRNIDMVRACLDSLVRHLDEVRDYSPRLIAINDSPDDEAVEAYLRQCHADGLIDVHIRNPENLGFVRSVNKGLDMARRDRRAALLVNSAHLCRHAGRNAGRASGGPADRLRLPPLQQCRARDLSARAA